MYDAGLPIGGGIVGGGVLAATGFDTVGLVRAARGRTAGIAEENGGDSLIVLRRRFPDARKGKGEALNDAVRLVRELVAERGQDVERVLVTVMDADGRLSDGAMAAVLPL